MPECVIESHDNLENHDILSSSSYLTCQCYIFILGFKKKAQVIFLFNFTEIMLGHKPLALLIFFSISYPVREGPGRRL